MAREIKETPILTARNDIIRVLMSIEKPKKVTKAELEERKRNFDYLESIKTFK